MNEQKRIVLVTGASRGIGAEVANGLAGPDTHVIVGYRQQALRANGVVDAIRSAGGHATAIAADLDDETDVDDMFDVITERFGKLDAVVLCAAGGRAQRHVTRLALLLMPVGGQLVYATSHQAHFFPHKAVPMGYAAVAASKRAGETALYAMRQDIERAGVHFTVASGDLIDGTSALSAAIVNAASTPHTPGIVFVGSADYLMTAA